jgi:hypothetical protein
MKPVVIISFDHVADPRVCDYTLNILNDANIQPTLYVQSNLVGSRPWRSTINHLQKLYDNGWDLGNHSTTHPPLATLTDDEIDYEIKTTDKFLEDNNFSRGRRHLSYPQSSSNKNVIRILKQYCDTGRLVTGRIGKQTPVGDEWYLLDCISMKSPDPIEKATNKIDEAILKNGVCHIMFENIDDNEISSVPYQSYHIDKFSAIISYIKLKRDSGIIDVMNMSTFYNTRTNK